LSNLAKTGKIGGVAGVINRMLSRAQHIATITAMGILEHAGSPMARRDMRDFECALEMRIPPFEFDNALEAQVRNQVEDVMRDYQRGRASGFPSRLPRDRAQRLAMKVIKVSMGHQHHINRRQIAQL